MTRSVKSKVRVCGVIVSAVVAAACSGGSSPKASTAIATPTTNASDLSPSSSAAAQRSAESTKHARTTKSGKTSATTAAGKTGGTSGGGAVATSPNATPTAPGAQARGGTPTGPQPTPTTVYVPRPYDPSQPIDLGGFPGVTPAEQARAEKLVRDTLRDLPKYADPNVAYSAGYRTINDAATGDEHYVNWGYVNDGHILDSKRPESLVYEMRNGKKTLVAAMYMMPFGSRFTDVPDVGGPMTQWHIHNDLCLADSPSDPKQKVLSGLTTANGACPPGTSKAGASPMLHVWIVKNKCGPFAALDGIGGGQIPAGQQRLCDTVHGA